MLARMTPGGSRGTVDSEDRHRPATGGCGMTQIRIAKPRTASARRREEREQLPQLDPRDPDIVRARQLQRRPRRLRATR